jgi:acetyl esterase
VTLDPGAANFLEQFGALLTSTLETEEDKQALYELAQATRDVSGGFGGDSEPVTSVEDRDVPGGAGNVPVRIYRPDGDGLPLIVFMHGGVFVLGGLEMHDAPLRRLANVLPAVVVSVDYRAAPRHPHPAAIDDSQAVLAWAAAEAPSLGATGPLVVMGDSAGGALAALLAVRARDEGGPKVDLQVLLYPMIDPALDSESAREFATGYLTTAALLSVGWEAYLPGGTGGRYTSPSAESDLSGLPPAVVMTAGFDPLRDEGLGYIERLRQANVTVDHLHFEGQIHGFVFMGGVIPEAPPAFNELVGSIRRALAT